MTSGVDDVAKGDKSELQTQTSTDMEEESLGSSSSSVSKNTTDIDTSFSAPLRRNASSSSSEDEVLYASIEQYQISNDSTNEVPATPTPALPERRKATLTEQRLHVLYNDANKWLNEVHRITKEIEQKTAKLAERLDSPKTNALVNLEDNHFVHFDSISMPSYSGPSKPTAEENKLSHYLKPVPQPTSSSEPIYAVVNKKSKVQPKLKTVDTDREKSAIANWTSSITPPQPNLALGTCL